MVGNAWNPIGSGYSITSGKNETILIKSYANLIMRRETLRKLVKYCFSCDRRGEFVGGEK